MFELGTTSVLFFSTANKNPDDDGNSSDRVSETIFSSSGTTVVGLASHAHHPAHPAGAAPGVLGDAGVVGCDCDHQTTIDLYA